MGWQMGGWWEDLVEDIDGEINTNNGWMNEVTGNNEGQRLTNNTDIDCSQGEKNELELKAMLNRP